MKTSYKIALLFVLFSNVIINAQEKITGNKVVTTEDRNITDFTKIQIIDDFNVFLIYNEKQSVSVESDSNLQNIIITEVKDGILTLKSSERIGRSKALNIHLTVNKNINEILTYNNSEITSNNTIIIDSLTINAFDNSEINLKLNSQNVTFDGKNNANINLEILSSSISGRLEDACSFKGSINTQNMELYAFDKGSVSLSGTTYKFSLETLGSTIFKGKSFVSKNAIVKANNSSTIYINATENLELYSNNASEIHVYSNPTIVIHEFNDTAIIRKKELN
jgi:hypothetical protein